MLIGGLVTNQLISSSVVGVGSVIDGSQSTVWLLTIEGEFRRIMKNAVTKNPITLNIQFPPTPFLLWCIKACQLTQ